MPRRNRKKKNGSRNRVQSFQNQGSRNTFIPFRVVYSQNSGVSTTAFTNTEISMTISSLGARIIDAGDIFTQFRLQSLNAVSVCTSTVAAGDDIGGLHGIGFTGTNPLDFVTPSTLNTFVDMPAFNFGNTNQRIQLKVPTSELYKSTPSKWYNTSNASDNFSAGAFEFFVENQPASGVSYNQIVVISGLCELRGPIDPALVPLPILERRLERDLALLRERLRKRSEIDEKNDEKYPSNDSVLVLHPID